MADNTRIILKIENISFSYNGEPVLVNAGLEIREKDFVWIVGPNGGGKTTLLKLIIGLLKPSSGTISLFGKSPEESRSRIGYMTQHAELDPKYPLSVLDIVLMGRLKNRFFGFIGKKDKRIARQALDETGLLEFSDRPFSELSGGQIRKLLVARALATEPEILILDEPTANLDQKATRELYDLLKRLNERLSIIMVSHDPSIVSEHVKRVFCVNRHVHEHPTSEVDAEYLGHLYGGQIRVVRHDQDIREGTGRE